MSGRVKVLFGKYILPGLDLSSELKNQVCPFTQKNVLKSEKVILI